MNKEELNGLLDNIYELEGLVHLALAREDCPESLPGLIVRKAKALTQLVDSIVDAEEWCVADGVQPVDSLVEEDLSGDVKTEIDTVLSDKTDLTDEGKSDVVEEPVVDEEPETVKDEEPDYTQETVEEESAFASYSLPVEDDEVSSEENSAAEESQLVEEATEIEEDSVPEDEPVAASEKNVAARVEPRGKLVFTINDRYRFKRDLFCNSDADFNTTLALVASMDSYDEAEDYFLGELQWNSQREEVMDFLDILKNYFK